MCELGVLAIAGVVVGVTAFLGVLGRVSRGSREIKELEKNIKEQQA